jgi:hypothetical protein
MAPFFVNLPPCLIGMEACGSAHHWARKLQSMGHTVRLMAPQFVKPYVKTNKNDAADAEAIAEAVARPNMRFVPIKDVEQQAVLALHRVARRGIYDNMRTAVDKVHKGKGRTVNARFAVMCAHYLYDPDFCNVASGWEKGRVEKNVQDSRRRIWIEAGRRRFGSFVELNAWLGERCRALWNEVRHPEHSQFSVAEMLEHERPQGRRYLGLLTGSAQRDRATIE